MLNGHGSRLGSRNPLIKFSGEGSCFFLCPGGSAERMVPGDGENLRRYLGVCPGRTDWKITENIWEFINRQIRQDKNERKRIKNMRFYTTEDLEELLKIGKRQARALMRTNGFPSIRIGREYRVEEEAFLNWIHQTKAVKLDYTKC